MDNSAKIIESWNANAEKWITTINNEEIESRKLVTNKAIIDAVMEYHPESIIDIGCGEGWLARELQKKGSPNPTGKPFTVHSIMPPTESFASIAFCKPASIFFSPPISIMVALI